MYSKMSKWAKNTTTAVGYPDGGEGNDPKPLGSAFHHLGQHFYIGQYGSNDLPWSERSALFKCF